MESFLELMQIVIDFAKTPIEIYGFTFSFWDIFLVTFVFSIVCAFIGRLFS